MRRLLVTNVRTIFALGLACASVIMLIAASKSSSTTLLLFSLWLSIGSLIAGVLYIRRIIRQGRGLKGLPCGVSGLASSGFALVLAVFLFVLMRQEDDFGRVTAISNLKQLALAMRAYQEAARLAPKQPAIIGPLQFALGQLAMRLNQFQTAEQAFVQVLMVNAADYQARFLLSQAYEKQNKLDDAFRECSYVVGPLGQSNPAVSQLYQRLRAQLGR